MASRAIWLLLGLAAAKPKGVRLRARVSEIHVAGKLALGAEVSGHHYRAFRMEIRSSGRRRRTIPSRGGLETPAFPSILEAQQPFQRAV